MKIAVIAQMGIGTFSAKLIPLSRVKFFKEIIVFRKSESDLINKLRYKIYPCWSQNKFLYILLAPFYIARQCKKEKVELIICYHFFPQAIFGFAVNLYTKIPFIFAQTGIYEQKYVKKFLLRKIVLYILKRSFIINVPGEMSRHFWINNGIKRDKIQILHSSIDCDYFSPDKRVNKQFDFLILSRLAPEKKIDKILEFFYRLTNENVLFSAVIVGDGPKRESIYKQIILFGLENRVLMAGFHNDVLSWFRKSKIFLMHSISEGLPTSLMQAMSCELIPVSTSVGNIPYLIDNETGFLSDYKDSESYFNNLKYALLNYDKLSNMSKKAREKIIKYHSHKVSINKWSELIESIINTKNNGN